MGRKMYLKQQSKQDPRDKMKRSNVSVTVEPEEFEGEKRENRGEGIMAENGPKLIKILTHRFKIT